MLDVLDKELEKRGHRFVRYADDCNIYVRSQQAGERVMAGIEAFLAKRLKLKVNKAKTLLWQIIRGTGFPNQIFSDSWVVGLMEGRPWRARGQVGNASLGDGSSLSWSVWVTRRGNGCVRFMWLG
jgi:hypothetical protein